jgi:hypothetical protein
MSEKPCDDRDEKDKIEPGTHITEGGIRAGGNITAGGHIAGRDLYAGDTRVEVNTFHRWQAEVVEKIEQSPIPEAQKQDVKEQVEKIRTEAEKGKDADPGRLEWLINTLSAMAPDIFDVVVATLGSPLAGIGLVLKKIGEKARVEAKGQSG